MDDRGIVDLYWQRSETAIEETDAKYNGYCYSIAYNILVSKEDAEESVSDTWLAAWNTIPPRRPVMLSTFLGKITRHVSIDRWRARSTLKRGAGEVPLVLEELDECISDGSTAERQFERRELARVLNRFLDGLSAVERSVFLCRYWYMDSVPVIAEHFGFSRSKVTSMLRRLRLRLQKQLEKEGYS